MKKKFGLIGYPLGHTMSPFIHKHLFEITKTDATYEAIETPPEKLKEQIDYLRSFDGFNITIPHKEAVIPLLSSLSESATLYGAVNTVCCKNGLLTGHSTDAYGFSAALKLAEIPLSGKVLILGCGGVARTIATECALNGCEVTIAVRPSSILKAKALIFDLKERFTTTAEVITPNEITGEYTLAVNGTPLGMYPNIHSSPLSLKQMEGIKYFFDAVYNPEDTQFIKTAQSLGKKAVSGMGMLVLQAAKAHQHWYGAKFEPEDIARLIALSNKEMRRLFDKT